MRLHRQIGLKMRIAVFLSLAGATLLATASPAQEASEASIVAAIERAHESRRAMPSATRLTPDLSEDGAYRIQRVWIRHRLASGETIAGFKAGFMTPTAQASTKLGHPAFGVLLKSASVPSPARLREADFGKPMIETEIGFEFGHAIKHKVRSIADLQRSVRAIRPTIELPDAAIEPSDRPGIDLIAANIVASRYVPGPATTVRKDLRTATVTLKREDEIINQGSGRDADGDPWRSLLWVVNAAVAQGYRIEPGQIIITGTLGAAQPATSGHYIADYGDLGSVRFEFTP